MQWRKGIRDHQTLACIVNPLKAFIYLTRGEESPANWLVRWGDETIQGEGENLVDCQKQVESLVNQKLQEFTLEFYGVPTFEGDDMDMRARAFNEGYDALERGDVNPHGVDTPEWSYWWQGHNIAKEQEEERERERAQESVIEFGSMFKKAMIVLDQERKNRETLMREGFIAFEEGRSSPYAPGTPEFDFWMLGYRAGFESWYRAKFDTDPPPQDVEGMRKTKIAHE